MQNSQLPELKRIGLEMLQKLAEICDENHITYYLGDGSLLGAVRHQGFIPWDDDIDVLMPYEDYKRFLEIAQSQLGDDYFLQTSETDKNWYRVYATLRKENTAMIQNPAYHVNQGIWLDIFILGNARTKLECRFQKIMIMICNYMLMDHYMRINSGEFKKKLAYIGYWCFQLFYCIPWKWRYALRQRIMDQICKDKGGKLYPEIWCGITSVYCADCFEGSPSFVEFEGGKYNAPHNTDLFLKTQYGNNYMTPIKWERGHENIHVDFEHSYLEFLE